MKSVNNSPYPSTDVSAMFKNKVVLITGGSSGIGAATAKLFAKEGATVAIVGRNESRLNSVVNECTKFGSATYAIKADMNITEEVDTIVKKTVEKFGKLDILVNNAGILRAANILDEEFLEIFDEVMSVNMRGPARVTKHAVPHIIKTKGNIINVSSVAGSCVSRPDYIAYRTSKAALNHFTRCCAYELAKYGVRVNSVSPGPVKTNIFETIGQDVEALEKHTALQRVSESVEIADLIVYVASDKAKGVTGSDYVVDNGTLLLH